MVHTSLLLLYYATKFADSILLSPSQTAFSDLLESADLGLAKKELTSKRWRTCLSQNMGKWMIIADYCFNLLVDLSFTTNSLKQSTFKFVVVNVTDRTLLISWRAPNKGAMPIANTKSLLEQISDSINFEVDPLMGLHFKNDIMTVDVLKSQKLALVP